MTILLHGVLDQDGSVLCMLACVKIVYNNVGIVILVFGLVGGIASISLDKFALCGRSEKLALKALLQVKL